MIDRATLIASLAERTAERDQLRETVRRLNRRCQDAEGIIAKAGLVENRPQGSHGRSLGRALANYAAAQLEIENAKLREEIQRLKATHMYA